MSRIVTYWAEIAMSGKATMTLGKGDSLKFLDEDEPK
jgi:hypothetical protein